MKRNLPQQGLMPAEISPWSAAGLAYWILLCYYLKLATRYICAGPFWKDSGADLYESHLVTGPGQPVWSNHWSTACGFLCWAWVYVGRTKLHTTDGFCQHQAWAWEWVSKCLKAPSDLPPPIGCLLGLVTEKASSSTPQQGISSTGWSYCFPSRLMLHGGESSAWEGWLLQYEGMTRHRNLMADHSALSPEPPTPDSPYRA